MMEDDLGDYVLKTVWTLVGVSGLFLALRLYCKLLRARNLWWDDFLVTVAWLFLLVGMVFTTLDVQVGFGKHVKDIPRVHYRELSIYGGWSGTLSILAASLSKTSFAVMLLRMMSGRSYILLWFIIVTMNIAMFLNALFGWVQCTPIQKAWRPKTPGHCWNHDVYPAYGMFAGGYSALMDFILAALPWKIVWQLQMTTREKIGVALALSLGVFAGATAIVKTALLPAISNGDFTYTGVGLVVWGAAEPAVTVMATSIPVMRSLILEFKEKKKKKQASTTNIWTHKKTRTGQSTTVVTADRTYFDRADAGQPEKRDDRSDRQILSAQDDGKIVQTREVAIEYEDRGDVESGEFELSPLPMTEDLRPASMNIDAYTWARFNEALRLAELK